KLAVEADILDREGLLGADHQVRVAEIQEKRTAVETRLRALEERWEEEKRRAGEIQTLAAQLDWHRLAHPDAAERLTAEQEGECRTALAARELELAELQGEEPLVLPVVGGQAIASVVSGWTGIPLGKMVRDEIQAVLSLKERLQERV